MVNGESAGCGCDGLDSGDAMTFLGDGDINCADDDPDDNGDGPHLIVPHFNLEFVLDFESFCPSARSHSFILLLILRLFL